MSTEQLAKWLRIAIKQNEHDVQLTDEEIREARCAASRPIGVRPAPGETS